MGNVSILLRDQGHAVAGSDQNVYPPMSDLLEEKGIELVEGFSLEHLKSWKPDLIVVGNATTRGNPQIEWMLEQTEVEYISLPELLRRNLLTNRKSVVITGTHGKTTTATLAAYLLTQAKQEPGYLIGGIPQDLDSGATLGKEGAPFVIEGDEYDSAFFDKRSKFIHYRPSIAVINNLEFDHADIFRDLEDVKRSFRHFIKIIPSSGILLINGDDENLQSLLPVSWTQVCTVGVGEQNDIRVLNFEEDNEGSRFELWYRKKHWGTVDWQRNGLYNARNAAMAAAAAGFAINPEDPTVLSLETLANVRGVRRRQEKFYEDETSVYIEDFGHHPTAVKETLISLRNIYPEKKIVACFEPRSNTARTATFQREFEESFTYANEVLLAPIDKAERVTEEKRLNLLKIADAVEKKGGKGVVFESNEELFKHIDEHSAGRVFCFFSNGSFGQALPAFKKQLAKSHHGCTV